MLLHTPITTRPDPLFPYTTLLRAAVEPDQRLLLPPTGGGRDAGAGTRLRAGHCRRRARFAARLGPGAARGLPAGGRPYLLLRERRPALRHRAQQDARLHRTVGRALPRALRHRGGKVPPLPLRRAGELSGAHRAAAGEQRSEEHTSELQSLMRISYAVFCLKKKNNT